MLTNITKKIKSAPKVAGVYIFYKEKSPLYVGKASNLKNRLQNYLQITDIKTKSLHREADRLRLIKLNSNIEALIVESQLIKKLKPKYNVLFKDDKNYFYVAVTKEKFPRIFITHQRTDKKSEYVGPFTEGQPLKALLRLLRKRFPYCTCKPHFRICLNSQINNCHGYCCNKNAIPTKEEIFGYKKNIKNIKSVLTGKNKGFIKQLKDPYELLVLEKIWAHKPYLESSNQNLESIRTKKLLDTNYQILTTSQKVECYDNSHLSGKEAVGAMTAWRNELGAWTANKNMWRKFKIRGNYTEDDPRMMEEIVSRRLNHPEWPYPDLIIIDGGITQLRAAQRALRNQKQIKLISFAKPQQLVFGLEKNPVPISQLPEESQKLIKMAIQNTHNFVIRYHRKIRDGGTGYKPMI
jgi:excinuclease ABC subunit C